MPQGILFLNYCVRNTDLKKASANPQRSESNRTPPGSSALTVLLGMASTTALGPNAAYGSPGQIPEDPRCFLWGIVVLPTILGQEGK